MYAVAMTPHVDRLSRITILSGSRDLPVLVQWFRFRPIHYMFPS